ncbi:aminobutyraldehyde dehydrogenase [Conexibacter woesei]|uniref:aldehyde dehydrogenase (NAD(+)) n=1 Tax=Conexibacter woesei (strain DSM 14684 / CCUG 47730 / CIP 108061 / JCM 11494 / NBRC 100937 / ID131577) TaxID=469383 RepID=D3F4G3_CONWI|nr:aminobutyraldehyde dehydrogenase [Conexibacter woesei]ADB50535.1 Aminobutyraldehyde dehydrogenase [Conexibacter woesei DSM 14684]
MSTIEATRHLHIGGEPVAPSSDETIEVLDPATGRPIATVPAAGAEDVERAVAAAARAFEEWRWSTPAERADVLLRLADALGAAVPELGELESRNTGKPLAAARGEIAGVVDNLRFFAGAARCLHGPVVGEYKRDFTTMIRREPIGVVGLITPWNYPLNMAIWKLGPALACGNTCVLKPSELTPLTTLRLAEIAADIIPPGVLNVITGTGEVAGAAIVEHPLVRLISLTGDTATGRAVARAAAQRLKRVHLELGGKAPVVVLDDADPQAVAQCLRGASFWNAGQDCTAATRVIAGAKVYDELLGELATAAASLKVGAPGVDDVEMGPLISRGQQERVLGFIERAGGEVVTGGGSRDTGFFVEPTVVANVGQQDEIVQREIFGPVVTVQRADSAEEAIRMANDVPYGLSASIWSRDVGRALDAVRRLEFGTVWVNDHITFVSEMPHGGFKESGYGKDLSMYALEDFSNVKNVMARLGA